MRIGAHIMRRILLIIVITICLATPLSAQVTAVPPLMNFQARLTRADGTPLPDGNYSIQFSLFTALTGGTQKWTETLSPISLRNGIFAVVLANTAAFPAGTFNGD